MWDLPDRCASCKKDKKIKTFTIDYQEYTISVFPFIEGTTLYQRGASNDDLARAATLIATIHQQGPELADFSLPQETFDNPHKPDILRALHTAASLPSPTTPHQHKVAHLLLAEQADLLAFLEKMEHLQSLAKKHTTDWVLTHGDPNLDNLLKDSQGTLHLTDWGDVAMGPPERDLAAFTGETFEASPQQYVKIRNDLILHRDIFAFYFYRWGVQESYRSQFFVRF